MNTTNVINTHPIETPRVCPRVRKTSFSIVMQVIARPNTNLDISIEQVTMRQPIATCQLRFTQALVYHGIELAMKPIRTVVVKGT